MKRKKCNVSLFKFELKLIQKVVILGVDSLRFSLKLEGQSNVLVSSRGLVCKTLQNSKNDQQLN